MSERWINECEQIINRMEKLASDGDKDRLEVINSIIFTLNALERSISGWKSWIRNLSIMSRFDLEELEEIDENLRKQVQKIIEYDMEATKKWEGKFPTVRLHRRRARPREEGEGLYV